MAVQFNDFSVECEAELNDATIAWLYEASNELASQTKRNCQMARENDPVGIQLKGSYKAAVDESAGKAQIGTPLEAGYWEEFGTGEHAAHGDGRQGWWVYVKGDATGHGGKSYSETQAKAIAASMRRKGLDAQATNGRDPAHTLQNAFTQNKAKIINRLKSILGERMGEE